MVRIRAARALEGFRLHLVFTNGAEGEVDLSNDLWGPAFEPLRDPARFAEVRVDPRFGTVVWPGDVDLDPDVLYHRATGAPPPAWATAAPDGATRPAA